MAGQIINTRRALSPDEKAALIRDRVEFIDGALRWIISGRPVRFTADKEGYLRFCVSAPGRMNVRFGAHRVIWLLHYGEWPRQEIDHVNRDPADNRIENLRDVGRRVNAKNRGEYRRVGGPRPGAGVRFEQRRGKWRAEICVGGKTRHIGTFKTEAEARAARRHVELEYARQFAVTLSADVQDGERSRQVAPVQTFALDP